MEKKQKNFVSALLTFLVIGFLIIAGPASAVELKIESSNNNPYEGQTIDFTMQVDIEDLERVPITDMTVEILDSQGAVAYACSFDVSGNPDESCHSSFGDITKVNTGMNYENTAGYGYGYGYGTGYDTTNFGYGYGYGYGYSLDSVSGAEFKYKIKWTAQSVSSNTDYEARMRATADDGTNTFEYMTTANVPLTVHNKGSSSSSKDNSVENPQDTTTGDTTTEKATDDTSSDDSTSTGDSTTGDSTTEDTTTQIAKSLGIDSSEIESVEEISDQTFDNTAMSEEEFAQLDQPIADAIKNELSSGNEVSSSVTTNVKVYEVTKKDGTVEKVVKISKQIKVEFKDNNAKTYRVVEVIPKEVALSAANGLRGNFDIVEDDPVIAFNIPKSEIINGVANIEYDVITVAGSTSEQFVKNIKTMVVEKADTPQTQTPGDSVVTTPTTEDSGSSAWVWILVLLVIVAIVGAGYYFSKKK